MADDPDAPSPEDKSTPRRRSPRKTAAPVAAKKPAPRRVAPKPEQAETDAVPSPAKADAKRKAVKAVKPRAAARPVPRAPGKKTKIEPKSGIAAMSEKVGGLRSVAALAGSLAAGAAATAALLTLRGSTSRRTGMTPARPAHQPDGADSSASFDAGIADENMIPAAEPANADKVPTGRGAHQPDGADSSASFEAGIADESTIPD